jgi:hypothetical protein
VPEVLVRVAKEYVTQVVRIPEDVEKQVNERIASGLCVGCGKRLEEGEATKCYDCIACYSQVRYRIKKGKLTKAGARKLGLIGPDQTPGRPASGPMSKRLAEL